MTDSFADSPTSRQLGQRYEGPKYFYDFPNLRYAVSANSAGIPNYITIKDYFHLLKPRDDIFREDTIYTEYIVKDGERPDQLSMKFYEDEQYYWVILQINEITNYYNQWPLSQLELDEYITRKYQSDEVAGQIHHYETLRVTDINGNILLREGLQVPKGFEFKYRPDPNLPVISTSYPIEVTNRTYEYILNREKSVIQILQPQYVFDYAREVQNYALNLIPQESFAALETVFKKTRD
jgi:hypothetical protein